MRELRGYIKGADWREPYLMGGRRWERTRFVVGTVDQGRGRETRGSRSPHVNRTRS